MFILIFEVSKYVLWTDKGMRRPIVLFFGTLALLVRPTYILSIVSGKIDEIRPFSYRDVKTNMTGAERKMNVDEIKSCNV